MTVVWAEYTIEPDTQQKVLQGTATCDACYQASIAFEYYVWGGNDDPKKQFEFSEDLFWYPKHVRFVAGDGIPSHIAKAASEAYRCAAHRAPMAAVLMARTVVEATAKSKGVTQGRLVKKIDTMAERGLIRADTKEAAHEIRDFGNDMAHGDIADEPTTQDVADVLAFMDEVLQEVFIGPVRIAQLKERRLQAKQEREEAKAAEAAEQAAAAATPF
ncbi:DUF4145 domain-containing protein [Microbacterium sp. CFBP9034]|uniref:DUF4145 domain-containing protein n=1 Tax=Microbacterium sp. CFBP9034 TaxID=3096540 RepID=UPI002A6ACF1D|nr:DUF4145 domain-containing protein [Microbacterium sp. CFBP9034]MDY0909591.1 DUF4145 domain-containing protein [Microbacterium sp. CFBP9034]